MRSKLGAEEASEVFTPMDKESFILDYVRPEASNRTSNICRMTSQIVTGVEVLEILSLLEGIRKLNLPR